VSNASQVGLTWI